MTSSFQAISRIGCTGFFIFLFPLVGGCQSGSVSVRPETEAANAAGLERAILFDQVGGPVDVADHDSGQLTLVEVTRLAVTTHPQIQAALAQVRTAQADARQVRLLPNPILSLVFR